MTVSMATGAQVKRQCLTQRMEQQEMSAPKATTVQAELMLQRHAQSALTTTRSAHTCRQTVCLAFLERSAPQKGLTTLLMIALLALTAHSIRQRKLKSPAQKVTCAQLVPMNRRNVSLVNIRTRRRSRHVRPAQSACTAHLIVTASLLLLRRAQQATSVSRAHSTTSINLARPVLFRLLQD